MTSQTDMPLARMVRRVLATVLNGAATAASAKGYIRRRAARVGLWSGVVAAVVALGGPVAAQAQPVTIHATAGQQFSGVLGYYTAYCARSTLECPGPVGTATINWGDGTPSDANTQVAYAYGRYCNNQHVTCMFQVSGSHTYTNKGTYTASFAWTNDTLYPIQSGTVAFNASVN